MAPPPIVFYDGVCGLCNRFVRWIQARDTTRTFRFAPLQGETARARLSLQTGGWQEWSIVLLDEDGRHERSDAALRIARHLGGTWGILGSALSYVPRAIRDGAYRFIASRRYTWFGRHDTCPIPTPTQRDVMLP